MYVFHSYSPGHLDGFGDAPVEDGDFSGDDLWYGRSSGFVMSEGTAGDFQDLSGDLLGPPNFHPHVP